MTRRRSRRRGITLYEVVLSLAILLGSMAALGQLIATGSRAATQARLRTESMMMCESLLNEVIAGSRPMTAVPEQLLEQTPAGKWIWSLRVTAGRGTSGTAAETAEVAPATQTAVVPHPDLVLLQITVSRVEPGGAVVASNSLDRLIRNRQIYVDAANQAAQLAAEAEANE